jgi:hypothetical protein
VPFENLLKLEADMPDYQFYTFERMGLGGQETIGVELSAGMKAGVVVPGHWSGSVWMGVIAVPTKVMEELKTKENLAKLLSRFYKDKLPAGVVIYTTHGGGSDLKENDPRTKVENVITVSRDEKAGVKFTAAETPGPAFAEPADGRAPVEPAAKPDWVVPVAGGAAALALIGLGVWYFRRK